MVARILFESISMVLGISILGGILSKVFSKADD